jgi:excinuclease ABC subunit C
MAETPQITPGSAREQAGVAVIEASLKTLPHGPGVYRMISAAGDVLYVGKARDLRKRVASYVNPGGLSLRVRRVVAETTAMEFVTTRSEAEALLLEANLIKRLKPRYNILLRDDKSLPSVLVTGDHPFPQVLKHRGAQSRQGDYFGPFASAWAVNRTLHVLQRAFLLRSCSDAVFAQRTRPCLLHQIKRCSAPCVGRIGAAEYGELVAQARAFLRGESQRIQEDLARCMERASEALAFEEAARFRDRIRALTQIQTHQDVNVAEIGDVDVIAACEAGGQACVQIFFFRGGCNYGNRACYPDHAGGEAIETVLAAFVGQFYAERTPPREVLVSHALPDEAVVAAALAVRAGGRVRLMAPQRGVRAKLLAYALENARDALSRRMAEQASQRRLLEGLVRLFDLEAPPERIEVYDNSHVSGSEAIGAMVVAGREGPVKSAYRKFTIRSDVAPGDDSAMMREVLTRRFGRAFKEDPDRSRGAWPDLVLIDGGAGQLGCALKVFEELGLTDIPVAAIAKGPQRNAGRERIFLPGREPLTLAANDPVLYFLQRMRDEAHRFAVTGHRAKRSARMTRSQLDEIPGIGPQRKRALLHHFGSVQAIARAARADFEAVSGISATIANKVYEWFHPER